MPHDQHDPRYWHPKHTCKPPDPSTTPVEVRWICECQKVWECTHGRVHLDKGWKFVGTMVELPDNVKVVEAPSEPLGIYLEVTEPFDGDVPTIDIGSFDG